MSGRKPYNPARKWTNGCWIASLAGIVLFFSPIVFDIDIFQGGGALFFVGLAVFLTGLASGILFWRLAVSLDSICRGEHLLAHWTYAPEEWSRYSEAEHDKDRRDKWALFRLVAIIAVVVGVGFTIVKHNDTWLLILTMIGGLIALIGAVAYLSIVSSYRANRTHPGEAYIGNNGLLLGRSFHYWRLPLSFLHSVAYKEGAPSYLEIVYSAQSGIARGQYTVRVPVPKGQEDVAKRVIESLTGLGAGKVAAAE
ncbi:MAG: hypothetical protein HY681_05055 [Chloroflexi bacterium]|nr:hypothetical protein [Chloroflexota bacterium]